LEILAYCLMTNHVHLVALKYVELNPVRAKLCRRAWRYPWSSAALNTDEKAESELLNLTRWYKRISAQEWRKKLAEGLTDVEVTRIRLRTHTGRPLGSDRFLAKLETLLGRRVRPLPVGRPNRMPEGQEKIKRK
jgi:putative transposase